MSDTLEPMIEPRFVLGPNASLSVRGAWIFMISISFTTLGLAGWCAAHGFWPVLPFAGLELAAVGWALVVSMRRNRYREVVSFDEARVRVEFGVAGQGARSRVEMPRAWTRVWLERDATRRHAPTRLVLGCSGQRVVIGQCLTDEEREALLVRFRNVLRLRPVLERGVGAEAKVSRGGTLGEG
jgi:uncharacterized membrane protein